MERYTMFLDWKNPYCENWSKAVCRLNAIPIKLPTAFFTEREQKNYNLYGNIKDPKYSKQSWKKNRVERIRILTSDFITKLQSSRQYDTGTKTEIQINGTG